jgi:hypothetical protein
MSLVQRSGRSVFVGATNLLFFVYPFVDYFCCSIWHYNHWYVIFDARRFWTFLAAFAILGVVLDIVHPSARIVNVTLWILFALKTTGAFFSLWGSFAEDAWMAIFIVPLSLSVAWADFVLYRPKLAVASATSAEGIK